MNKRTMLSKPLARTTKTSFLTAGLLAGILCLSTNQANAVSYVTIQPNNAGDLWILTASFEDLNNDTDQNASTNNGYDLESSITSSTIGSPTVRFSRTLGPLADTASDVHWNGTFSSRPTWNDIGEYIGISGPINYNNKAFATGYGGVSEVSGGPAGAYFDKDGGTGDGSVLSDDLALIVPYAFGSISDNQTFVISGTIDTGSGVTFGNLFIAGTYANNPNLELVVSADSNYSARLIAVPEPSSTALLGLGGLALLLRRRR